MDEENALSDLLEPSLPGAWIAEHHRIWQMDLLDADALGSFSRHRGLDSFYITITELWQLGLIKADLITSHRELQWVGLVDRGTDGHGRHIYSDERQIRRRRRTGKYASNNLKPLQKGIKLLFHPFRYYVLYHLHRFLKPYLPKIHAYSQNFLDPSLSFFKYWAGSEEFVSSIRKWNAIASLCIITEPCSYLPVFHSLRYSLDPVQIFDSLSDPVQSHQSAVQEIRQHMVDYWQNNVEQLYYRIGKERLEEIRIELGFNAKILDPNEWVQTLICLADSKLRLEVEGHLGGAVLLRTMAEMLRRASENAFNTQLPEEDELGFGRMKQIKETFYGSSRVLDVHEAGSEFARRHGLNYKPRFHFYCEGATEYGAVSKFFQIMGLAIPLTNLHGLIKEKHQMLTFFRDKLQSDIQDHVYSFVMIDGDLPDNVRVIANHARINQTSPDEGMFGRFFVAKPDFEYENFEIEELEEILWKWAAEKKGPPSQADRKLLHNCVKDAKGSKEFFDGVGRATRSLPQLEGYKKGAEWGEKLMEYVLEHPFKQSRERQITEALEWALYWEKTTVQMRRYEDVRKSNMVDPQTGELIARPSPA